MSEELPSKHAVHFEAVKIAMNQTRDGYKLVLALHPHQAPEEILRSLVGSRYMFAAVELDDNEEIKPLKKEPLSEGQEAVQYAGRLCREPAFQRWMFSRMYATEPTAEAAAIGLRSLLGVESRRELADDPEKRRVLHQIARSYLNDSG